MKSAPAAPELISIKQLNIQQPKETMRTYVPCAWAQIYGGPRKRC